MPRCPYVLSVSSTQIIFGLRVRDVQRLVDAAWAPVEDQMQVQGVAHEDRHSFGAPCRLPHDPAGNRDRAEWEGWGPKHPVAAAVVEQRAAAAGGQQQQRVDVDISRNISD